jgi:hypothetical protein
MGFWAWFWIWVVLALGSLAIFALIGKSLFNRAVEVAHQLDRIAVPAAALVASMGDRAVLAEHEPDLLVSPSEIEQKRQVFLNLKSKKRAVRQRSLRSALKNIDVNESRFTND